MRSDHENSDRPASRKNTAPIPGMPYGLHTDSYRDTESSVVHKIDFIESKSPLNRTEKTDEPQDSYNSWAEMGWQSTDAPQIMSTENGDLFEEPYRASYTDAGIQKNAHNTQKPYQNPYPQSRQASYDIPWQETGEESTEQFQAPPSAPYDFGKTKPYAAQSGSFPGYSETQPYEAQSGFDDGYQKTQPYQSSELFDRYDKAQRQETQGEEYTRSPEAEPYEAQSGSYEYFSATQPYAAQSGSYDRYDQTEPYEAQSGMHNGYGETEPYAAQSGSYDRYDQTEPYEAQSGMNNGYGETEPYAAQSGSYDRYNQTEPYEAQSGMHNGYGETEPYEAQSGSYNDSDSNSTQRYAAQSGAYDEYAASQPYKAQPEHSDAEAQNTYEKQFSQDYPPYGPVPPVIPPRPSLKDRIIGWLGGRRAAEPWRAAVMAGLLVGLMFCALEIYELAANVISNENELAEYRAQYITENGVDFTEDATAVELRPAGETYPPTASPVPEVTPTPTPRIEQNDPLIAVMNDGGLDSEQSVSPSTPTPTPVVRSTLERYPDNPLLDIDDTLETMQDEINEDIVGELVIDDVLDVFVVQNNNTYYLNHNYKGDSAGYGAVFMDERISLRTPPEIILLRGRTSNEGKGFEPLKDYITEGLDFASEHAFFTFTHIYEEARYVIFAIFETDTDQTSENYFDYSVFSFASDDEMIAFAEDAKSHSLYNFDVDIDGDDRLLALVTLSEGDDNGCIVILSRMLRDGESDGNIEGE